MPSYASSENRGYLSDSNENDYRKARRIRAQDDHDKAYGPVPIRTRKTWPPSPSVEDEEVSLSREQSPVLPELEKDGAPSRGTIDQTPILVEVGKEHEIEQARVGKKGKRDGHHGSSSTDSSGPDTPPDSDVSDAGYLSRSGAKHGTGRASSRSSGVSHSRNRSISAAPHATEQSHTKRPIPTMPLHTSAPHRLQEDHGASDGQHLYPGTLEELRSHPREAEHLGYAQRHRTMSGSENSPVHYPSNVRHMSAMGYSGEAETPSFPRDHPHVYASPLKSNTYDTAPGFRMPKARDHDAIVDSSDSDVSPDEVDHHPHRTSSSKSGSQASHSYNHASQPTRERQQPYSRTSSSERHSGQRTPSRASYHRTEQPALSRATSNASSRSPYPSPPASPKPTSRPNSRPSSRDGGVKFVYPTIEKRPQLPSRPGSSSADATTRQPPNHVSSNLRHSSRPSSPVESPGTGQQYTSSTYPTGHRDGARNDPHKSRTALPTDHVNPSEAPTQPPRPPRSPRPGLTIDVHEGSTVPAPQTGPEMHQRSSSGHSHTKIPAPHPTAPLAAPSWPTHDEHSGSLSPNSTHAKAVHTRQQMRPCPRPGYSTKYNDWWTIPAVPELDLCPDCKQTLHDSGYNGTFMHSPPRPPGTQTRCDLSIPWIRMACLLVLSGREKVDILHDLIKVLSNEEPCPAHHPDVRAKWYRVYDEDADKHVTDFNICPECTRAIRILFPNLKGSFTSHTSSSLHPKRCDLKASVTRFAKYIDLLDNSSMQGRLYRADPDTKHFIRMVRDFAGIRPCPRDNQFRGMPWHYIHHMPDFTICEECFMEVVRPAQRAGFDVAEQVSRKMALPYDAKLNLSCQLYSARMRAIFGECCQNRDVVGLREHSTARVLKERELQHHAEMAKLLPEDRRDEEMQRLINEWRRWE